MLVLRPPLFVGFDCFRPSVDFLASILVCPLSFLFHDLRIMGAVCNCSLENENEIKIFVH